MCANEKLKVICPQTALSEKFKRRCLGEACKLQSVPAVGPLGHSGIEQTNMVKWGNNVQCKHQPVGSGGP